MRRTDLFPLDDLIPELGEVVHSHFDRLTRAIFPLTSHKYLHKYNADRVGTYSLLMWAAEAGRKALFEDLVAWSSMDPSTFRCDILRMAVKSSDVAFFEWLFGKMKVGERDFYPLVAGAAEAPSSAMYSSIVALAEAKAFPPTLHMKLFDVHVHAAVLFGHVDYVRDLLTINKFPRQLLGVQTVLSSLSQADIGFYKFLKERIDPDDPDTSIKKYFFYSSPYRPREPSFEFVQFLIDEGIGLLQVPSVALYYQNPALLEFALRGGNEFQISFKNCSDVLTPKYRQVLEILCEAINKGGYDCLTLPKVFCFALQDANRPALDYFLEFFGRDRLIEAKPELFMGYHEYFSRVGLEWLRDVLKCETRAEQVLLFLLLLLLLSPPPPPPPDVFLVARCRLCQTR